MAEATNTTVVSLAEAKARGLLRYFTDRPCRNGHVAERWTSSRACVVCMLARQQNMTPEQRERKRQWSRERYHSDPQTFRERSRDFKRKLRAADPEKMREATNAWERANRDKRRAISQRTIAKHRERVLERKREADRRDPQKQNEQSKAWQKNNPLKRRIIQNKNLAHRRQAVPKWLTREQNAQIKRFYWLAQDCSLVTGEPYWVDHIVPLRGKNVCGLHVPWNLQVLPKEVNQRKNNRHE